MAYRSFGQFQPRQDTGWGLIYRLNLLFGKVETDRENCDLDSWNKHIDAIHSNASDQRKMEVVKNESGEVTELKFQKEDTEVLVWFAKQIKEIKDGVAKTKEDKDEEDDEKKKKLAKLDDAYYNVLVQKDMWIRKYLGDLYRKVVIHDPRSAIYGG